MAHSAPGSLALFGAFVLIYAAVSLDHVTVFPPVGQDEPWIAASAHRLATEGVYGSDLFEGYYSAERRLYQYVPLYPLALAAVFEIAGTSVWSMRLLPVFLGGLVLVLTYLVGRQMAGHRTGLVSVFLLLFLRAAPGAPGSGIPLLDLARVGRYDIAVPVFGLLALWLFQRAEGRLEGACRATRAGFGNSTAGAWLRWIVIGAMIGLAGLSHLYGAFWLPALVVVLSWRYGRGALRRRAPYGLAAGFLLAWIPWLAYVASGWTDFLGQRRIVAGRFDVLDPIFYVGNVRDEISRYRPLAPLDAAGGWQPAHLGIWLAVLGIPLAVVLMLRRAQIAPQRSASPGSRRAHRAGVVAAVLVVQAGLFALLLQVKMYNYLVALWPLAMLCLSWLLTRAWDRSRGLLPRIALAALVAGVAAEGTLGILDRRRVAAATTPYEQYMDRIAGVVPPGARVLGLPHYWLGLRDHPYRSWGLPALLADSAGYHAPMELDEALELVAPDAVLMDRHMRRYFEEIADPAHPRHHQLEAYRGFMARHGADSVATIDDATYGAMTIWVLRPAAPE